MRNEKKARILKACRYIFAMSALSACGLALATPSVYADTFLLVNTALQQYNGVPKNGVVASSVSSFGVDHSDSASTSSRYGVVKGFASAHHTSMADNAYAAGGSAGFTDDITITYIDGVTGIELYHGQWATVALDYYMNYSLSAAKGPSSGHPASTAIFDAKIEYQGSIRDEETFLQSTSTANGTTYTHWYTEHGFSYRENVSQPMHILHLEGLIQLGMEFSTTMQLGVTAFVPGESISSALADAAHSGYWAGIQSVSIDGNQLMNYTVTSASGTDYSQSMVPSTEIPEPASPGLMFAGALCLIFCSRTKERRNIRRRSAAHHAMKDGSAV